MKTLQQVTPDQTFESIRPEIISICSLCKLAVGHAMAEKLEQFEEDGTPYLLSHGFHEECAKLLYPDLF